MASHIESLEEPLSESDEDICWVVPNTSAHNPVITSPANTHECVRGRSIVLLGFIIGIKTMNEDNLIHISLCDCQGCCVRVVFPNLCQSCKHFLMMNAPLGALKFSVVVRSFKASRNEFTIYSTSTTSMDLVCDAIPQFKEVAVTSLCMLSETSTSHYPVLSFILPFAVRFTYNKRKCARFEIMITQAELPTIATFILYSIDDQDIIKFGGKRVILTDVRVVVVTYRTNKSLTLYASPNSLLVDIESPRFVQKELTKSIESIAIADVKQFIEKRKQVKLLDGTRGFIVFHMGMYVVVAVPNDVPLIVCHINTVFDGI